MIWENLPETPSTARTSVTFNEQGFAHVALTPQELETIMMQQEDKLSASVRLAEIDQENKAQISQLIIEASLLIQEQKARHHRHQMIVEDHKGALLRVITEQDRLRTDMQNVMRSKTEMEAKFISNVRSMKADFLRMKQAIESRDVTIKKQSAEIAQLREEAKQQIMSKEEIIQHQQIAMQRSTESVLVDLKQTKEDLEQSIKTNKILNEEIIRVKKENGQLAFKIERLNEELKKKEKEIDSLDKVHSADLRSLSEREEASKKLERLLWLSRGETLEGKAVCVRMYALLQRWALFYVSFNEEKERETSETAAAAMLREEALLAKAFGQLSKIKEREIVREKERENNDEKFRQKRKEDKGTENDTEESRKRKLKRKESSSKNEISIEEFIERETENLLFDKNIGELLKCEQEARKRREEKLWKELEMEEEKAENNAEAEAIDGQSSDLAENENTDEEMMQNESQDESDSEKTGFGSFRSFRAKRNIRNSKASSSAENSDMPMLNTPSPLDNSAQQQLSVNENRKHNTSQSERRWKITEQKLRQGKVPSFVRILRRAQMNNPISTLIAQSEREEKRRRKERKEEENGGNYKKERLTFSSASSSPQNPQNKILIHQTEGYSLGNSASSSSSPHSPSEAVSIPLSASDVAVVEERYKSLIQKLSSNNDDPLLSLLSITIHERCLDHIKRQKRLIQKKKVKEEKREEKKKRREEREKRKALRMKRMRRMERLREKKQNGEAEFGKESEGGDDESENLHLSEMIGPTDEETSETSSDEDEERNEIEEEKNEFDQVADDLALFCEWGGMVVNEEADEGLMNTIQNKNKSYQKQNSTIFGNNHNEEEDEDESDYDSEDDSKIREGNRIVIYFDTLSTTKKKGMLSSVSSSPTKNSLSSTFSHPQSSFASPDVPALSSTLPISLLRSPFSSDSSFDSEQSSSKKCVTVARSTLDAAKVSMLSLKWALSSAQQRYGISLSKPSSAGSSEADEDDETENPLPPKLQRLAHALSSVMSVFISDAHHARQQTTAQLKRIVGLVRQLLAMKNQIQNPLAFVEEGEEKENEQEEQDKLSLKEREEGETENSLELRKDTKEDSQLFEKEKFFSNGNQYVLATPSNTRIQSERTSTYQNTKFDDRTALAKDAELSSSLHGSPNSTSSSYSSASSASSGISQRVLSHLYRSFETMRSALSSQLIPSIEKQISEWQAEIAQQILQMQEVLKESERLEKFRIEKQAKKKEEEQNKQEQAMLSTSLTSSTQNTSTALSTSSQSPSTLLRMIRLHRAEEEERKRKEQEEAELNKSQQEQQIEQIQKCLNELERWVTMLTEEGHLIMSFSDFASKVQNESTSWLSSLHSSDEIRSVLQKQLISSAARLETHMHVTPFQDNTLFSVTNSRTNPMMLSSTFSSASSSSISTSIQPNLATTLPSFSSSTTKPHQ
ncbi:uncharacterized protein MONOS_1394 [Monocercomonoides exilis]|uniref:uncharacterized protein n=1 Tax=Monocercomonoides exilis TaxID=2049356 RepID=UPI00355A514C|nr:hypothetical protein MONOS_1394 [Monocercomonoides exilis]|eukprot:MONOS_1394.1-p1 / transcript=MONOS_1394.1 / gene=MONOS_1394 / organism=Monocercomonoides_exilis_PA203 / gene_product=unspecified product / transcript_product=unspecified product / location=Mono_scaffold00024:99610-104160(-) / protein_length=1428 / sequence_SO=supercontig / SO=protein_coding / is_pseudo=false